MAAQLFARPSNAKTSPAGTVQMIASGGTGTGYAWTLSDNQTGGSVDAVTGVYTAGALYGTDTVAVTDAGGTSASSPVMVLPGTTLLDVRTQARERADMVNSQFVSDAEWNRYINASLYELYDLLVQKYGDHYFTSFPPYSFVTDGQSDWYALPPDFYKLVGVDLQINNSPNGFITLKPFNVGERNRFSVPNLQSCYGIMTNLRYRVAGQQAWFIPRAAAGQTVRLFYVPRLSRLVEDTDVIDGISGWEEYVIVDAAIKAMVKEESDPAALMGQKAGLIARIESAAANRDAGNPMTVSDTAYQGSGGDGWGNGIPGSGWGGY